MKRFLFAVICLVQSASLLYAQDTEMPTTLKAWAEHVESFGKKVPQEEVFIHMDNTSYFLGDTLHYKAYLRRSDGAVSNLSGLLYVELYCPDGFLVERQKLRMTNGQGYGAFALADSLYGGYYELRAYTRWQLNWGEFEHPHTKSAEKWFYNKKMAKEYYRDYEKLYSRVFPVYDAPKTPGDYTEEMTMRPLLRYFKHEDSHKAELSFFPEGGWLVAGTNCRMAFQADDEDGRHLAGTLTVRDNHGNTVATAQTEHRGRGMVSFDVKADTKYTAEFAWDKYSTKEDLPKITTDGVAMQVNTQDGSLNIQLSPAGAIAEKPLGVTVMCHGIMQDFKELGKGGNLSCQFNTQNYPSGVAQITVFDAEGNIYADRLVFVRQDQELEQQQITFSGISQRAYDPFDRIKLGVKGKPGSTISLAVRDAAHSEYINDNANIMTEMLLASQIRGFVEAPTYYFESNDEEHQHHLDLLLMVQGWRRYNWQIMGTPKAFTLKHMPERTQLITGDVNVYQTVRREDLFFDMLAEADETMQALLDAPKDEDTVALPSVDLSSIIGNWDAAYKEVETNIGRAVVLDGHLRDAQFFENEGKLKREVLVHAEFSQPGGKGQKTSNVEGEVSTYGQGQFKFDAPAFEEGLYFFLAAADTSKWEKKGQTPENFSWTKSGVDRSGETNYPDYYVRLSHIYPRFVKPYDFYQQCLAPVPSGSVLVADPVNNMTRNLDQVTIGAQRNGLRTFDKKNPAFVIDAYEAFNDVCDAGFCPGYYLGQTRFIANIARTYIGDMNMERLYPVEPRYNFRNLTSNISKGEVNKYNTLQNLDKVYIYTDYSPRREGDKQFEQANQPMVTVDLHRFMDDGIRNTWRDRRYILFGYSASYDFYQPNYKNKPLPSTKDYRRTLYWNPNLQLDQQGNAKIDFYNNSQKTQISVSAEGLATDGTPITGLSMPEDR